MCVCVCAHNQNVMRYSLGNIMRLDRIETETCCCCSFALKHAYTFQLLPFQTDTTHDGTNRIFHCHYLHSNNFFFSFSFLFFCNIFSFAFSRYVLHLLRLNRFFVLNFNLTFVVVALLFGLLSIPSTTCSRERTFWRWWKHLIHIHIHTHTHTHRLLLLTLLVSLETPVLQQQFWWS